MELNRFKTCSWMTPITSLPPFELFIDKMAMEWTCQRCLRGLGTIQHSKVPYATSLRPRQKRWLATHAKSSFVKRSQSLSLATRYQSTIGSQTQVPNYEPPEIRSPPALSNAPIPSVSGNVLLQPTNLFHPFSESPSPEIRRRAAFMKSHAYCPHSSHKRTRMPLSPQDPESRKDPRKTTDAPRFVKFECPDCGIPSYCDEDHWMDDYESHMEICDQLREINEDDHDLRSGRFFPEFEYPGPQMEEAMVNMTNWDTYLYSRDYKAINEERSLRQATRLLTYPATIGSILHELSPYSMSKDRRITYEGLRSLSGGWSTHSESAG